MTTYAAPAIDLRALIESRAPTRLVHIARGSHGGEYAGPCPWCHGNDRFRVWPNAGHPHYWCRGCHQRGDAIAFMRSYMGLSYQGALQELGNDTLPTYSPHQYMTQHTPPSIQWQDRGSGICTLAKKCLWSPKGRVALDYLHRRGFHDETIKGAHLGYIPEDYFDDLSKWGIVRENLTSVSTKVFLPRGILIPWSADDTLWKITVRRPVPPGDTGRYREIVGSRECLWSADTLAGKTTFLYEGVFDALSGMQEAPALAHTATDDTHKCRSARWIAKLAQARALLIAYDADAAGEKGAAFWQKTFPQAVRWQPWGKDANAMLTQGSLVGKWIELGIATALRAMTVPTLASSQIGPLQCRVYDLAEALGFPALGEIGPGEDRWLEHLAYVREQELHIFENALLSLQCYLERHF